MEANKIYLVKTDAAKQMIFGFFYINKIGDKLTEDLQGDMWPTDEMEKTAYDFVLNARVQGENHVRKDVGRLIESIILTYEKQEAIQECLKMQDIDAKIDLGCECWFGGFKVDDAKVWEKVESEEYPMFSIGGTGERIPVED